MVQRIDSRSPAYTYNQPVFTPWALNLGTQGSLGPLLVLSADWVVGPRMQYGAGPVLTVQGISKAAIKHPQGTKLFRDWTGVSCMQGRFLNSPFYALASGYGILWCTVNFWVWPGCCLGEGKTYIYNPHSPWVPTSKQRDLQKWPCLTLLCNSE